MNIITSVELSKIPNVLLFSIVNPKNNDRLLIHIINNNFNIYIFFIEYIKNVYLKKK